MHYYPCVTDTGIPPLFISPSSDPAKKNPLRFRTIMRVADYFTHM
jgi:hypothetical protein